MLYHVRNGGTAMRKSPVSKIYLLIAICISCAICTSCASSQYGKASAEDCRKEVDQIMSNDVVCDPDAFDQFENTILEWQKDCSEFSRPADKTNVDDILARSRSCTEEERGARSKRGICISRINEVLERDTCWGVECSETLDDVKKTISDCSDPALKIEEIEKARKFSKELSDRIEVEKRLENSLGSLESVCRQSEGMLNSGEIPSALDAILNELGNNAAMSAESEMPKQAPVHAVKSSVFSVCTDIIKRIIDAYADIQAQNLIDPRIKKKPEIWSLRFSETEDSYKRLTTINAGEHFPGALVSIKETYEKFLPMREKQDAAAKKRLTKQALRSLRTGASQCRKLKTRMKKYEAKIAHYTERQNERKVSAYRAQLKNAKKELADLHYYVQQGIELGVLSEARLKKSLDRLEKAGCHQPTVTPAKEDGQPAANPEASSAPEAE